MYKCWKLDEFGADVSTEEMSAKDRLASLKKTQFALATG